MAQPPIFDFHCDLLSYMAFRPFSDPFDHELGCGIPHLRRGKVRMQICAIYTTLHADSVKHAQKQASIFTSLPKQHPEHFFLAKDAQTVEQELGGYRIGLLAAIENASGLLNESDPLEQAFRNLDRIISSCGKIAYISLTHHGENRFGGGNYTKAGLKEDGKALLEYISGKGICIDLSHTSDALADQILDFIELKSLDIRPIASHSNFRAVWDHPRNLRDETAKAIIEKNGVIGINFVRAFVDNDDPSTLGKHFLYALSLGAENHLVFGADFFYTLDNPDKSRFPFYHPQHEDASKYFGILDSLMKMGVGKEQLEKIAYLNGLNFLNQL
jgi:microsomal dipeptidase-like Zn-dependent dipeptidase